MNTTHSAFRSDQTRNDTIHKLRNLILVAQGKNCLLYTSIIDAAVRRGASVQGETGPNPPGRIVGIGFVELIEFRLLPRHKYLIVQISLSPRGTAGNLEMPVNLVLRAGR